MTILNNFRPDVWKNVQDYLTPELLSEADLEVATLKVTEKIGLQLRDYILKNKLWTFGQNKSQGRQVNFTYSPNFCVRLYRNYEGKCTSCYVTRGTPGFDRGNLRLPHSYVDERQAEYEEKKERCMTLNQIYFSMLRKYPHDLLEVQFIEKFYPEDFDRDPKGEIECD